MDPGWTREDTDYLFELCEKYDLRFLVVHDAFSADDGPIPASASADAVKSEVVPMQIDSGMEKKLPESEPLSLYLPRSKRVEFEGMDRRVKRCSIFMLVERGGSQRSVLFYSASAVTHSKRQ